MKIILTGRDEELLGQLASYYLLSTKQIKELTFSESDIRLVLRRLRKLEKAKYIERHTRNDKQHWVWSLGSIGRRIHGWEKKLRLNKNTLNHDLITNDVRIKLESLGCSQGFNSSYMLREKASLKTLPKDRSLDQIPDWICAISFNANRLICALEVELNYKGKRRMEKVFSTYSKKKSVERIIYFVPNKNMGSKILEFAKEYEDERGGKWILVINIKDFLENEAKFMVHYLGGKIEGNKVFNVHNDDHTVDKQKMENAA